MKSFMKSVLSSTFVPRWFRNKALKAYRFDLPHDFMHSYTAFSTPFGAIYRQNRRLVNVRTS